MQPAAKMVAAAKSAIPTINDQATAMQLTNCTKNMVSALADLRTAAQKVRNIKFICSLAIVLKVTKKVTQP